MGGRRKFRSPRCELCGLHLPLCVCADMPRIETSFEILVVQNNHERNKPTNTGKLIPAMVPAARLLRYAVRDQPFDAEPLRDPGLRPVLLFPRVEGEQRPALLSKDVLRDRGDGRRPCLVILDGTWGQCSRMSRRIPELAEMPAHGLPPGAPSRWGGVREAPDPSRICTFEALIRAVEIVDGPDPAAVLQRHFDRIAAGMLFMKAKLPSPQVPTAWS